jgi:5-methylcytosine-specific restriction endonuclease McrA
MTYSGDELRAIYDRTSGYCHLCHKKLSFNNYGKAGSHAPWEVEHSKPKANGGTNSLNNLYAACISCNRSKGASSTATARSKNGKSRAPLSVAKRKNEKLKNAIAGGTLGGIIGSIFGPAGLFLGALAGSHLGHRSNPDK